MRTTLLCAMLIACLLGCARRQKHPLLYQACWVGPYTKDTYCGPAKTRVEANRELIEHYHVTRWIEIKRFVRPVGKKK